MRNRLYLLFPVVLFVGGSALAYWLFRKGGGQWWAGAGLVAAVTAGSIVAFLWRYIRWRREERFVGAVTSLDEATVDGSDRRQRTEAGELQDHWKKSIETLRTSRLRRRLGNPLYALPWYLVIGESGSGKTTAIKNSNLHSPVSDLERTAAISATRTCDWWFFEEAIILDTAGRYTIPEDRSVDEEEWERFLVLLAEYRRREPVNGVIATIAADKLLTGDRPALRAEGQSVRRRIDQLMNKTGARFPVYLLVTKMDMVYGFTDTFLGVSDEESWQAAGYLDQDGDLRPQGVIEACFRSMKERLAAMRLERLGANRDPSPGALVLENQFLRLRPGLAEFAKAVFEENPYQEKPLLRGVFFSSARQTAQPTAPFLSTPIVSEQPAPAGGEDRGLFLRDLFARVLPDDRYLFTPISLLARVRWTIGSFASLAGLVVLLILCGFLSFSFLSQMTLVNRFTREFPRPPSIKGDTGTNLLLLQRMRTRILDLEKANRRWLLSGPGLRGSRILESRAKEDFVALFQGTFLVPFDNELRKAISAIGADTDDEIVGRYGAFLLARMRLLKALQKGQGETERTAEYGYFKKTCTPVVESQDPGLPAAIAATVPQGYFSYLAWMRSPAEMGHAAEMLQSAFASLQRRHPDLGWVATKAVVDVPDVTPADFWEPPAGLRIGEISVPGAYTMEGQRRIQTFLKTMADTSPRTGSLLDTFWQQYRRNYYEAWYELCAQCAGAVHSLEDLYPRETPLPLMAIDDNPCWRLIHRAAEETAPTQVLVEPPAWTRLLATLDGAIRLSREGETKGGRHAAYKGGTPKEEAKERLLEEIKKVAPVADRGQRVSAGQERLKPMARAVEEYRKDIAAITHVAATKEDALRTMSEAFSEQPGSADSGSPVQAAYSHLVSIKELTKEAPSKEGDTVWHLFEAPFRCLLAYGAAVACSVIEEHWEKDVWAKADSVLAESRPKLLFDKDEGLVPKFLGELADPFLTGQKSNPRPRKLFEKTPFERSIPFSPQFLSFIGKGETPGAAASIPRTIARCGK